MRYRIGIYDKDVTYCLQLMEYINMNKDYMLHSICFSDAGALLECLNKDPVDLILYGQASEFMEHVRDKCKTLRLAETDEELYVGERYLYKYQRVDVLVQQILACLETELDKPVRRIIFYGIYSPIGRCGKTSFALGICYNFPGSLYVGMNSYIGSTDVSESFFAQTEQFFYQLLTHNESIVFTIQDIMEKQGEGCAVIYGMRCFTDYKQISVDDIVWLKEVLAFGKIVSRVVFDVGASVLADFNILDGFDHIFVPCLQDAYANRRLNHFKLLVDDCAYAKLRQRIEYVEVPAEPYDSPGMRDYVRRNVR